MSPDRIEMAKNMLMSLWLPLRQKFPHTFLVTDTATSTIIKYGKNSALATRLSEANLTAFQAETLGAFYQWVRQILSNDPRIGSHAYLFEGCGYGGSCFPKDVRALDYLATHMIGYPILLIRLADLYNEILKRRIARKLAEALVGARARGTEPLKGKQISVAGLTFKADTDDVREASAVSLVIELVLLGANVVLYDPILGLDWNKRKEVEENFKKEFIKKFWGSHPETAGRYFNPPEANSVPQISFADSIEFLFEDSNAVTIVNEWPELKNLINRPDFSALIGQMRQDSGKKLPVFMDARSLYNPQIIHDLVKLGFFSPGVGRPTIGARYLMNGPRAEVRTKESPKQTWLKEKAPQFYGKTLIHVSPAFKPSPEWLANFKDERNKIRVGNGHQAGGLEPLVTEELLDLVETGMNGVGVSLKYAHAPMQQEDGSIVEELIDYQDAIDAGRLVDLGIILVPIEGKEESVRVWAAPYQSLDGKSAINLLLEHPEITTIIYPKASIRKKQMLLLGRGALALIKEVSKETSPFRKNFLEKLVQLEMPFPNFEPVVVQANEALSAFVHPQAIDDRFKDDVALNKLIYGTTTHTPVESGLQKFPAEWAEQIRINPSWRNAITRNQQLDITLLAMALSDTINAVSEEHGKITEQYLYPEFRGLIPGIVNGIHLPHWQLLEMSKLVGQQKSQDHFAQMTTEHAIAKRRFVDLIERKTGTKPDSSKLLIVEARRKTSFKSVNTFVKAMQNDQLREEYIQSDVINVFMGKPHSTDQWGLARVKELKALTEGRIIGVDEVTMQKTELGYDERLKGRIFYMPNFNVAEADIVFQGADVMGMWSLLRTEASATGYMKTMANANPVLVTRTGGPLEHIRDGENGIFINEYDSSGAPTPRGLIEGINKLAYLYYESQNRVAKKEWDVPWHQMMWSALQTTPELDIHTTLKKYIELIWYPAYLAKQKVIQALEYDFHPAQLTQNEFELLLAASAQQKVSKDTQILTKELNEILMTLNGENRLAQFLEPISKLTLKEAEIKFGRQTISRLIFLIAMIAPSLLENEIQNWNSEIYSILKPIQPDLLKGKFAIHATDNPGALAFSRTLQGSGDGLEEGFFLPIYWAIPPRIGDETISNGKIWFTIYNLSKAGVQPGILHNITDYTAGGVSYDPKGGDELRRGWKAGISYARHVDHNQIQQPDYQVQLDKLTPVGNRSEARAAVPAKLTQQKKRLVISMAQLQNPKFRQAFRETAQGTNDRNLEFVILANGQRSELLVERELLKLFGTNLFLKNVQLIGEDGMGAKSETAQLNRAVESQRRKVGIRPDEFASRVAVLGEENVLAQSALLRRAPMIAVNGGDAAELLKRTLLLLDSSMNLSAWQKIAQNGYAKSSDQSFTAALDQLRLTHQLTAHAA